MSRSQEMSPDPEEILHHAMDGGEALQMGGRFEAPHLAFAPPAIYPNQHTRDSASLQAIHQSPLIRYAVVTAPGASQRDPSTRGTELPTTSRRLESKGAALKDPCSVT